MAKITIWWNTQGGTYSSDRPVQTGFLSADHKSTFGPNCGEHLQHRGHLQMWAVLRYLRIWAVYRFGIEKKSVIFQFYRPLFLNVLFTLISTAAFFFKINHQLSETSYNKIKNSQYSHELTNQQAIAMQYPNFSSSTRKEENCILHKNALFANGDSTFCTIFTLLKS